MKISTELAAETEILVCEKSGITVIFQTRIHIRFISSLKIYDLFLDSLEPSPS